MKRGSRVPRRAVPDHAVGGIDRLVGGGAGEAGDRHPQGRRHHAVGEILRQAFDRGPRHAGLIERLRVAPHDVRYCNPSGRHTVLFEGGGDAPDMLMQAALSQE